MQGCTPLHIAAAQGQAEVLRLLLRHGADISVTDDLVRLFQNNTSTNMRPAEAVSLAAIL